MKAAYRMQYTITRSLALAAILLFIMTPTLVWADEDFEELDSDQCVDCHDESEMGSIFQDDLDNSIHEGIECLDCHIYHATDPPTEQA